eukprot:TRINITY_DN94543_c0_g1_i1.p1 TRINITY_DN94543_c0_g1~~TRINITY_DN94543_c0_g1_i1.p1  ORF type:complete len:194 (-),score=53.78 TRINITY_DN94543_c0_g1_i1:189-770(-)
MARWRQGHRKRSLAAEDQLPLPEPSKKVAVPSRVERSKSEPSARRLEDGPSKSAFCRVEASKSEPVQEDQPSKEERRRLQLEAAEKRQLTVQGVSPEKVAELMERQKKADMLGKIKELCEQRKLDMPLGVGACSAKHLRDLLDQLRGQGAAAIRSPPLGSQAALPQEKKADKQPVPAAGGQEVRVRKIIDLDP